MQQTKAAHEHTTTTSKMKPTITSNTSSGKGFVTAPESETSGLRRSSTGRASLPEPGSGYACMHAENTIAYQVYNLLSQTRQYRGKYAIVKFYKQFFKCLFTLRTHVVSLMHLELCQPAHCSLPCRARIRAPHLCR